MAAGLEFDDFGLKEAVKVSTDGGDVAIELVGEVERASTTNRGVNRVSYQYDFDRYFTMRKRMQEAGQTAFNEVFRDKEQRFVQDHLHTVSRRVVEWIHRVERPVIVFEDLKDIRNDIVYGTRMNRRLHSLPFAKLREFITYKAAWQGIPSDDVDPEYTSQQCTRSSCEHTERANRCEKRFKCRECGRQDHPDRGAGISVAKKWLYREDRNCLLSTLSRRRESGSCDGRHRGL